MHLCNIMHAVNAVEMVNEIHVFLMQFYTYVMHLCIIMHAVNAVEMVNEIHIF